MSNTRGFLRAKSSVVIISATNNPRAFCSGCVLRKTDGVEVVCPRAFVEETQDRRMNLEVCFSDGRSLPADVLGEHGVFCLLRTPEHDSCVGITWLGNNSLDPGTVFTFVPKSPTENEQKDGYLAVESVKAFKWEIAKQMVNNSDDYFMILCDGPVKNAAPVFTPAGALGLVIQNCRDKGAGTEMKVVLKASAVKRLFE